MAILLLQTPKYWDYRHVPPCLAQSAKGQIAIIFIVVDHVLLQLPLAGTVGWKWARWAVLPNLIIYLDKWQTNPGHCSPAQLCVTLLLTSSLSAPLSLSPCNLLLPQFLASSQLLGQSSVLIQCKEWVLFLICMHLFGSGDVIVLGLSADGGFSLENLPLLFLPDSWNIQGLSSLLLHLSFPLPSYRHLIRMCVSDWKSGWNSDWRDWTAVGYHKPQSTSPPHV